MTNEKQGGPGCWQMVDIGLGPWYCTVDVYFSFYLEKAIELIGDGGQTKRETDIYHHGPRPQSIICQLPDPPFYSLVATFNYFSV